MRALTARDDRFGSGAAVPAASSDRPLGLPLQASSSTAANSRSGPEAVIPIVATVSIPRTGKDSDQHTSDGAMKGFDGSLLSITKFAFFSGLHSAK
jgi:hypothetical protein